MPGTHPVTETSRKEGTEAGPGPAVDPDTQSELQAIPLRDENQIVLDSKGDQNARQIAYGEIVFQPLLIYHQTLYSERFSNSPVIVRLNPQHLWGGKSTYLVDFAPVLGVCRCASDTGEAGKKPFGKGVD